MAVAARWPQRPRHPHHTSPTPPPAALQHPVGRRWPHLLGGHSTTSCSSHPCGLRHPLPRRQTGHPWPRNRLPQNQGPTLPWRPRDKGGPSPLPEARTPWGGGEDISTGPLHPPLSAPHSLEPWRGEPGPLCQHIGCRCTHRSAGTRHPTCMDLVQSCLGAGGQNFRDQATSPEDSPHPRGLRRLGWLLPWSSGASRPRSPPLGMQSLLRMCACICVCVFIRMSLFKKQSSLWGS